MLQAFKVGLAAKRCDCTCGDIPEEFLRVVTLREPWELQQLVKAVSFATHRVPMRPGNYSFTLLRTPNLNQKDPNVARKQVPVFKHSTMFRVG